MKDLNGQLNDYVAIPPQTLANSGVVKGAGINVSQLEGAVKVAIAAVLSAGTAVAKLQTAPADVDGQYVDFNPAITATLSTHSIASIVSLGVNLRESGLFLRTVVTGDASSAGPIAAIAVAERVQS